MMRKNVFEVLCVSTVSAGKSMLLNALMGRHLLPTRSSLCTTKVHRLLGASNEATTRCRCRTSERGRTPWQACNRDVLAELGRRRCLDIELDVCFPNIGTPEKNARLCLVDTPGTNSTHTAKHADMTRELLAASDYQCLIVVMNGVYQGATDERLLLEQVFATHSGSRSKKVSLLFALSMMDRLDVGESPIERLHETHAYLTSLGFENPVVIPVMAHRCLLIRSLLRRHTAGINSEDMYGDELEHLLTQLPRFESQLQSWLDVHRLVMNANSLTERASPVRELAPAVSLLPTSAAGVDLEQLGRLDFMTGIPQLELVLGDRMSCWSSKMESGGGGSSLHGSPRKRLVAQSKTSARRKNRGA